MYIDTHIHARDFGEAHKDTIEHILKVAETVGMTAVAAMPNTNPAITNLQQALFYMQNAEACKSPVKFLIYFGITNDPEQVKQVPQMIRDLEKMLGYRCVMGIKQYCAHSTGNIGVIHDNDQLHNMAILAEEGYEGVLVAHAEDHSLMDDSLFNPASPRSWAEYCRPPHSEIISVHKNIAFKRASGFKGRLHIAHTSMPESVYEINQAKKEGMNISCEVTPQHILLDWNALNGEYGLRRKMNPPLRHTGANVAMRELLKDGSIDCIGTDHAPHTLAEKTGRVLDAKGKPMYASGMTGLQIYPSFIEHLRKNGFSEKRINEVTFSKANELFKLGLEPRVCVPKSCPQEYEFNPYEGTGAL